MDDDPREGLRRLHAFHEALLLVEEVYIPRKFVLCGVTGRPIMPMPHAWDAARRAGRLDPDQPLAMFVPEDADDCLQLLVAPELIDPRTHEAADRYQAYHGKSTEATWGALTIESAKWPGAVCDGDQIMAANPLRSQEPALCRQLNADRDRLARLCQRATGTSPHDPVAVGADPGGVDVRARFGVIRVEFPRPAGDAQAALAMVESMLAPG